MSTPFPVVGPLSLLFSLTPALPLSGLLVLELPSPLQSVSIQTLGLRLQCTLSRQKPISQFLIGSSKLNGLILRLRPFRDIRIILVGDCLSTLSFFQTGTHSVGRHWPGTDYAAWDNFQFEVLDSEMLISQVWGISVEGSFSRKNYERQLSG